MSFKKRLPNKVINKAMLGDKFALTHIYHEYKSAIFGMAYGITSDKDLSEDILHQVIEKVLLKISELNEPEKFNGWLKTLSYRTAIDYLRLRIKENYMDDAISEVENSESMSTKLDVNGLDIEEYLKVLNARERLVIRMFLIEGFRHQEIAQELGVTEVNSKQIYRRSLSKLKQLATKTAYSGVSG